jgi:hypothetical protein
MNSARSTRPSPAAVKERTTPASSGGIAKPRVSIDDPASVNASNGLTPPSAKNIAE